MTGDPVSDPVHTTTAPPTHTEPPGGHIELPVEHTTEEPVLGEHTPEEHNLGTGDTTTTTGSGEETTTTTSVAPGTGDPIPPTTTTLAPPPDPNAGPAAPATPLLAASASFTAMAGTDPGVTRYGRGGTPAASARDRIRTRFLEAGESLSKSWQDYQDKSIAAMKSEVKKDPDANWKTDGYADTAAGLPDVTSVLKEWQKQKERDPFDAASLSEIAGRLETAVTAALAFVADPSHPFPGETRALVESGLQGLSGELARQTSALDDPIASATAPLDAIKPLPDTIMAPGSELASKLKTTAGQKNVVEFWDYAKSGCMNLINNNDKKFGKSVTAALDADLKASLTAYSKATTASTRDGAAILSATREVASILQAYDQRLAVLYDTPKLSMNGSGGVAGLREALRLLGKSVSTELKWLEANDAFTPST